MELMVLVMAFGIIAMIVRGTGASDDPLSARLAAIDGMHGLGLQADASRNRRSGQVHGCAVVFTGSSTDQGKIAFEVKITLPAPLPITIGPDLGRVWRSVLGPEPQIGCPDFDATARILGAEVMLRVLLVHPVRQAFIPLLRGKGDFNGRTISVDWKGKLTDSALPLMYAVDAAAALVQAAEGRADPAGQLAQIAEEDPQPGVRLGALRCMLAEMPDDPRTEAAVEAALGDVAAGIRRVAAVHSMHVGTLEALLAPGVSDDDQRAAVEALARCPGGLQRLQARLGALDGTARAAAAAALRAAGRAHEGGLALADSGSSDGPAGGLALTAVEAGQLALHGSEPEP